MYKGIAQLYQFAIIATSKRETVSQLTFTEAYTMKTLSTKTIARTTKFIKESNGAEIQTIKTGAIKALQERNPNGSQYAIASLELELISKL